MIAGSIICFAPTTAILGKPKELLKDGINFFNHFLLSVQLLLSSHGLYNASAKFKDVVYKTMKDVAYIAMNDVEEQAKDMDCITMKDDQEPTKVECKTMAKMEEPAKEVEFKPMKDVEELQLVTDIEDMKSKLIELESKLSERLCTAKSASDKDLHLEASPTVPRFAKRRSSSLNVSLTAEFSELQPTPSCKSTLAFTFWSSTRGKVAHFCPLTRKVPECCEDCDGLNNLLMAYEDKSAYALCVFSLALGPEIEPITFMGKLHYAELPKEEKNKISHRSRALSLVRSHFAQAEYAFQMDPSI
ncbi:hypothetical protein TEA_011196 [Camellia sinensis var. sinensis]|uniref:Uncharacterized protein n=1 Tax=Camellia sinensis var. sinensis TaxID=542762 RepID=A0A4S4E667_CAMSN|nr:hypothetical protein TEA_011196 [Camellia sinensis var. sinensis]